MIFATIIILIIIVLTGHPVRSYHNDIIISLLYFISNCHSYHQESVQKETGLATDRNTGVRCKTTFESPARDFSEASNLSLEQSDVANNGEKDLLDIDGFQKVEREGENRTLICKLTVGDTDVLLP